MSDTEWADYLYRRRNNAGFERERWWHEQGCQMWIWILRDRTNHEILAGDNRKSTS